MHATTGAENVLLVDDVVTTGATLKVACKALENAGHRVLGFITFAETESKRVYVGNKGNAAFKDGGTNGTKNFR